MAWSRYVESQCVEIQLKRYDGFNTNVEESQLLELYEG